MEYKKLGNTGMDVSRFALGCMGFADPASWHHPWTLKLDEARPIIKHAFEMGVNYFDTADIYGFGTSEEITGQVLKEIGHRDEIIMETKFDCFMRDGANGAGASRKRAMACIDASLKRLQMDYVDLYLIHRWDDNTPIEETLEAMNDIVRAGKALYIGCSTMKAWQFQKAVNICERNGWAKPVVMQSHYNLIYREEESEMIPYCNDAKIQIAPYSSLAGGKLTHPHGVEPNKRAQTDVMLRKKYGATDDIDAPIIDRVEELAGKYGFKMSSISLSWLMSKGCIPLAGADSIEQIDDYVKACEINLTPEECAYLEEPYQHHGFVSTNRMATDPTGVMKIGNK